MVPVIKKAASDCTTKATIQANAHWVIVTVAKKPGAPVVGRLQPHCLYAARIQKLRGGTQPLASQREAERGTLEGAVRGAIQAPRTRHAVGHSPPWTPGHQTPSASRAAPNGGAAPRACYLERTWVGKAAGLWKVSSAQGLHWKA
jgi:hypothetical protein